MKTFTPPDDRYLDKILSNKLLQTQAIAYLEDCQMSLALNPSDKKLPDHIEKVKQFLEKQFGWNPSPKLPEGFDSWAEVEDYFDSPKPTTNKTPSTTSKTPTTTNKISVGRQAEITPAELEQRLNELTKLAGKGQLNKSELQVSLKQLALAADLHPSVLASLYKGKQEEGISKRLDELINSNLYGSELDLALIQLSTESGRGVRELRDIYQKRILELEQVSSSELSQQIDYQLALTEEALDIAQFLPEQLAEAIKRIAGLMNVRPEACMTALLCGLSSVHKSDTYLNIAVEQAFHCPPNLYGATVGESGTLKSPPYRMFIESPLVHLQIKILTQYKQDKEDLKRELRRYEQLSKEDKRNEFPDGMPEDELPLPICYFFTDATPAALSGQFDAHPTRIMMYLADELKRIITFSPRSDGVGVDRASLLSYYDGMVDVSLRVGGIARSSVRALLAMYGTIQPKPLRREMGEADEEDGLWSRFMFVLQPLTPRQLRANGAKYELGEMLNALYARIDNLPPAEYRLAPDAVTFMQKQVEKLGQKIVSEPDAAMRAVYSKSIGRIGRLALNLHCLHETFINPQAFPSRVVPKQRLVEATKLAGFYCHQVRLIHQEAKSDVELSIPMSAIVRKSKELTQTSSEGWVKARDLTAGVNCFKKVSAADIRAMFMQLQEMGQGTTRGQGVKLEFRAVPPEPPSSPSNGAKSNGN